MPATATFLGATLWSYPTVPGTYDLSTFIVANQDCPADSVMVVGSVTFQYAGLLPMGTSGSPPVTDDQGLSYFVSGGAALNTATTQRGAAMRLDFYVANRFNVLSAGQRIKLRRSTVTIGSPAPPQPGRGYAVDFAYVWTGANAVGTVSAAAEANPGGVIAVSSGAHLVPITGTYDLIGVGVAGLWALGGSLSPPVGSVGSVSWAEGGAFLREQTFLQDFPWDESTFGSSHLDGPGVFLSRATVTRASPTSEVYTATLTDPAVPPDANQWIGAYVYAAGLAPPAPSLGGVWNLQSVYGKYHHAYAKNDVIHYAQADSYRPPFVLDSNVAVLPSGAKDSEPKMVQRGNGDIIALFTRLTGATPAVLETLSRDEGTTWRDPVVAFSAAKHGDIAIDPTTGAIFRAAYVSGQLKGTLQYPGDISQSAVFILRDAAGAALAPDDDCFHVAPAGDGSRRWLLVMVKGGNVIDYQSTDDGKTWVQVS